MKSDAQWSGNVRVALILCCSLLTKVLCSAELYTIGAPPVCASDQQDCEDRRDVFKGFNHSVPCKFGAAVICEKKDNAVGQVWIGTSPFCSTSPRECRILNMKHIRTSNCGDGACCWTGSKQLCAPDPEKLRRPTVWLNGFAPLCSVNWWECHFFALEYVMSSSEGDGSLCLLGTKVLCSSQKHKFELVATDVNHLKVVTYNVFELPFFILHTGQKERTCRIPRVLLGKVPDADVVVFTELFMGGCWHEEELDFRRLLRHHGFRFTTRILGQLENIKGLKFINGGVMIASRWPIVHENSMTFDGAYPLKVDQFSRKGVVHAKIRKIGLEEERTYHVFGTHMQSKEDDDTSLIEIWRHFQIKELADFIRDQNVPESEAVIFAGDFNVDMISNHAHLDEMLDTLSGTLPQLSGELNATYRDPDNLDLVPPEDRGRPQFLDYVFFSRGHRQPTSADMQVLPLKNRVKFAICSKAPVQPFYTFPHSVRCAKTRYVDALSDHYPVVATLVFE